jgi:diamine N-acetyltransferase
MIRRAGIGHAGLLSEFCRKTFMDAFSDDPRNHPDDMKAYCDQAFSIETIATELANSAIIYLLDQRDDETVGYAKLDPESAERCVTARNPIEIGRLYPRNDFIGRGVADALMRACLDEARKGGHDVLWLGVWEFNPRAQKFYEKWGFRRVGEHTFLLGTDPQLDWIMQREV